MHQDTQQPPDSPISNGNRPIQREVSVYTPTSNLAIASIYCGVAGLCTCCLFLLSVLAIVLGVLSLRSIRTGKVRGRGRAITGIVIGSLGSLLGVATWIAAAILSSQMAPILGHEVSDTDRQMLQSVGVLQDQEEIVIFCRSKFLTLNGAGGFAIEELDAVITADRLVAYNRVTGPRYTLLSNIEYVRFKPAESWIGIARFMVMTTNGASLHFEMRDSRGSARSFYDVLQRKVSEARQAAGKPDSTLDAPDTD